MRSSEDNDRAREEARMIVRDLCDPSQPENKCVGERRKAGLKERGRRRRRCSKREG